MGTSIKRSGKIITFLCIAYLSLPSPANSANALPTAEDINRLAKREKSTADTFMQESFELRMQYESSGKFLTQQDKDNLYKLAKRASSDLQAITEKQSKLKNQIEDYQGNDWDTRYGSTGLWRKLFRDLYTTTLSKCEINFYLALASGQPQRNKILQKILAEINSLDKTCNTAYSQFLKAKTLALLAQTDPGLKQLAKKEFNWLSVRSDMRQATAFRIAIERIKFLGLTKPGQLDKLTEQLKQSSCADDLELVLSLAFLQRRYDPEGFEKTVSLWPQTEDFIGSLALSDLSHRFEQKQLTEQNLQQTSVFDAELAAHAAWKSKAEDYKTLLNYLSNTEKFQTPLIFYVAAVAFADSSPTKAANLLIKASKLQKLKKSDRLNIKPCKIAEQAAQLTYNLFAQDTLNCQLALEAFENYCTIANEKIDEELEYLYTTILNDSGQVEKARILLQKIADRPIGLWSKRAKLDLIVQELQQTQDENQNRQNELLEQLNDFILNCHGRDKNSNRLRMEAINIYCQTLLESNDKLSAQKVLAILHKAEPTRGISVNIFKSKALQRLGKLDESAHHMLLAIRPNSGSLAGVVMELLSEIVDSIDHLQIQADDFDRMIQNCKKLAKFCNVCLNNRKSALLLAEISVFAANKEKSKLSEAENLLNNIARYADAKDVDLLRCQARLLTAQGKFEEAAKLWAQICKMRKSQMPSTSKRNWKWWRAKFHELDCWAKCPQTEKTSVLHTIEVLENSFHDIPPLWAEKLSSLKQQCGSLTEK